MNLLLLLAAGYTAVAGVRAVKRPDADIIDVVSDDISKLVSTAKDVKNRTTGKLSEMKDNVTKKGSESEAGSNNESA